MKRLAFGLCILLLSSLAHASILIDDSPAAGLDLRIADANGAADLYFDSHDFPVVAIATRLLADDVERVTGHKPQERNDATRLGEHAVLIGTVGHSALIDQLVAAGKLDVSAITGKWESFVWQTLDNPLPGVKRALVIAGSDRRGTAYGTLQLSKEIGVSPWYWWADVPPVKHDQLRATNGTRVEPSPRVKYRGIFINDEDWGFRPWASKTLDPATGNLGPKTYEKVFELMLRLRLNHIWPAMHPGSAEFSTFPGNAELADQWAIVPGSSHCEPMLRNNVYWPKSSGAWRYDTNRDAILNYWRESATSRGAFEAVWTLGIRGIHDSAMQGPKELSARVAMVDQIIDDQRKLIHSNVTNQYGPPAQCFIPYKEVLPIYNAGLHVPDDVTLIWPDDNFGYIRRFANAAERRRTGGSGVYYHVSYWGAPHSYLWVETTPPALIWEELRKVYDNDSRTTWVLNVGDIKPAEIAIDFYARLAWNPEQFGPDAQEKFLADFCSAHFGPAGAKVAALQTAYYNLASVRKPEHIGYDWVDSLPVKPAAALRQRYQSLLDQQAAVEAIIPKQSADAYFEMVGYPAQMLAATGLLYTSEPSEAQRWKDLIDLRTKHYNEEIAGGKWNLMIATTMEGLAWPTAVGGKAKPVQRSTTRPADEAVVTIDAAEGIVQSTGDKPGWKIITGLGWSGRAITVLPAVALPSTKPSLQGESPTVEYHLTTNTPTTGAIRINLLPTMPLEPGGSLRVGVVFDDEPAELMMIPGTEGGDEKSPARRAAVLAQRVSVRTKPIAFSGGHHTLKLFAPELGVVIDQIELPEGCTLALQ